MPNTLKPWRGNADDDQGWAQQFITARRMPELVGIIPLPSQQYMSSYRPQPTFWQMEAATPGGRLAFEETEKLENAAGIPSAAEATDQWYQAALDATRDRPSYAKWRAQFDQQEGQSNVLDQLRPNAQVALTGAAIGDSTFDPDKANAAMDSMAAKLGAYAQANPVSSALANLVGDFILPGPGELATEATIGHAAPLIAQSLKSNAALSNLASSVQKGWSGITQAADWLDKASDVQDIVDAIKRTLTGGPNVAPPLSRSPGASMIAPESLPRLPQYSRPPGGNPGPLDSLGMNNGYSPTTTYDLFGRPTYSSR